jgi:hypothetical protein
MRRPFHSEGPSNSAVPHLFPEELALFRAAKTESAAPFRPCLAEMGAAVRVSTLLSLQA